MNKGQDKTSAFKEAIENFDKKLNPEEDKFQGEAKLDKLKAMSPAEATGCVGLIATIVDLGFKVWDGIYNRLPNPTPKPEPTNN